MPRKVTDAIVSAFLSGKRAKQANTSTDGTSLFLHDNEIAKMENGDLWITNAGWDTRVTYERLNGIPGVSINKVQGKTNLNGVPWDGDWINIGKPNTMENKTVSEVKRMLRRMIKEEIIRAIKKKRISEAARKVNLSQPHSNLYIKGWGNDSNGNWSVIVGFPNDKGFAIQTNGNLPETHEITKRSGKNISDEDLSVIGKEITDYVKEYGSKNAKSRLKVYKQNNSESRLRENSNSGFSITYYATVGQHGDTGKQYSTYQSAMRDAIKNSMDEEFMDGLEYLGVEPFGDETKFAILYIEDRYISNVADYIEGEQNKKIWLSVAKRVLDGQNKAGGKGVVPQNGNFVNESKRRSKKSTITEEALPKDPLQSYLVTALWSSNDESTEDGGEPFDANYGISDIAPESVAQAKKDLADFIKQAKAAKVLESYLEEYDMSQLAHDFWLTRNGHGAGFWDRSYENDDLDIGEVLTEISKKFRELTPVLGDSGKIYFE